MHEVCLEEPFWIDVTEVTNGQFAAFDGQAEDWSRWTDTDRPRESITWTEANAFCQKRGARLSTEAEWEYAARGPDGLIYPWGNYYVPDNMVNRSNSGGHTWAVGSKPDGISWVGAYDLSGNVWEWVADWYASDYYGTLASGVVDPQGPGSGEECVMRGGSLNEDFVPLCGVFRGHDSPWRQMDIVGFRCALTLE